jgi:hypothetical protein
MRNMLTPSDSMVLAISEKFRLQSVASIMGTVETYWRPSAVWPWEITDWSAGARPEWLRPVAPWAIPEPTSDGSSIMVVGASPLGEVNVTLSKWNSMERQHMPIQARASCRFLLRTWRRQLDSNGLTEYVACEYEMGRTYDPVMRVQNPFGLFTNTVFGASVPLHSVLPTCHIVALCLEYLDARWCTFESCMSTASVILPSVAVAGLSEGASDDDNDDDDIYQ